MPTYKILVDGEVVNRVNADPSFMTAKYADADYELETVEEISTPTHKAVFGPKELYDSFTTDEALLALSSSNPAVTTQVQLLSMDRAVRINANDVGYQSAIALLESDGVLSAERAADYAKGIPLIDPTLILGDS